MEKVTKGRDLKVCAENRVGILADVTDLIAENGINIENICAYGVGAEAVFYMMTSDNEKSRRILEENGYSVQEREVIVLELWNRPGVLSDVAIRFKKNGIHLQTVYGTSSPGGGKTSIIFSCDDIENASDIFDAMVLEDE